MARVSWSVNADGSPHTIELEHKGWSGTRTIRVDGQVVLQAEHCNNNGGVYRFDAFGHQCTMAVSTWFLPCQYGLEVDGVPLPDGTLTD